MLDPISQFKIQNWFAIKLFSWDISFSNASFFMLLSFVLPVLLVFFACHKRSIIPGKLQAMVECTYMFILDMLEETSGKDGVVYAPFVFSVFIFILMANVLGMLPFCFTITSHIIVTFAIAAIVFVLVTFIGICKHKGRFLSLFFPPGAPLIMAPILVPVELLSYLSRPVSLAVRLFANMMAGHTMLKVFAGFSVSLGVFLGLGPLAINIILTAFEILVAILQAFVFTTLSCLYLSEALHLH